MKSRRFEGADAAWGRVLLLAAGLLQLLTATSVSADDLFRSDGGSSVVPATVGAAPADRSALGHLRRRIVQIDEDVLERARTIAERGPAVAGTVTAPIQLNLFEDASYRIVDLQTAPTLRGYSLSGGLEGEPYGSVTIVVNGDVIAGEVRVPGATYAIASVGRRVEIAQTDEGEIPELGEPLRPPGDDGDDSGDPELPPRSEADISSASTDIDVLVVYTPAARDRRGGTAAMQTWIDLLISTANASYRTSGVKINLRLARAAEVSYTETPPYNTLWELYHTHDGVLDNVSAMRDAVGADLVHMIVATYGACGQAFVGHFGPGRSNAPLAYSASRIDCNNANVFTHEIGHNMGLVHDRYQTLHDAVLWPSRGYRTMAYGYVNQRAFAPGANFSKRWVTVMAYGSQCNQAGIRCVWLGRHSNPVLTQYGDPTGVHGNAPNHLLAGPADAARVLNFTRTYVAAFRAAGTAPHIASLRRLSPTSERTNGSQRLHWRLEFDRDVRNVSAADFEVEGTGLGATTLAVAAMYSSRRYYQVSITGGVASFNGEVTLAFASGQDIQSLSGTALAPAWPATAERTWMLDNTAPAPSVSPSSAGNSPFTATVSFDEDVTGFGDASDVTATNATVTAPSRSDARTYTVQVTPSGQTATTVTLSLPAAAATDLAGNTSAVASGSIAWDPANISSLTISGFANATVPENGAWTSAAPTVGGNPAGTVRWTKEGADASAFTINPSTGVLSLPAQDFENPTDAGENNGYEVTVRATDAQGASGLAAVTVTVTDVNEGAFVAWLSDSQIDNGWVWSQWVDLRTWTSPQGEAGGSRPVGPPVNWTKSGPDGALFTLTRPDPNSWVSLSLSARDFSTPQDANRDNVYEVTVTACKPLGAGCQYSASKSARIAVKSSNSSPKWLTISGVSSGTVPSNTQWRSATPSVSGASGTVGWTKEGPDAARFSVSSSGVLTLGPQYRGNPTDDDGNDVYEVLLRATDTAGNSGTAFVAVTIAQAARTATVSESALTVTEAAGGTRTATYTVKLNDAPSGNVTVTPASGTPTAATVSGPLTFTTTNYATPQAVTVTGVDDAVDNAADRTSTVTHAATGGGYDGVSIAPVAVTVTDDDRAGVTVSGAAVAVAEAGGTATYAVRLDTQPTGNVTVTVASGDTSVATVSPGSLAFTRSNYATAQQVTVTGVDDAVVNPTDRAATVSHTASGGGYDGVAAAFVTVTARDDDGGPPPAVSVVTPPQQVNEGESATLTLELSWTLAREVKVPLRYPPWSAEVGDFDPLEAVTIPAGSKTGTGEISTNQDDDERHEVFFVAIDVSRLPAAVRAGARLSTHVRILDDDVALPTVALAAQTPVGEGSSTTVTVTLSKVLDTDVTIPLWLTPSEGTERTDFGALGGILIEAGRTSATGTIAANHDADFRDESFTVRFGKLPDGISARAPAEVLVTIEDDDVPPVSLSATTPVAEGSPVTVTATLAAALDDDVTIPLTLTPGTGTDAADFGTLAAIEITAGQVKGAGTVATNHDSDYADETFSVSLGALPDGVVAGTPASVTVTVTDDDTPPAVSLEATTPVQEGGSATVTATLSSPALAETTIPLTLTAGEGTDRADFGSLSGITVEAGGTAGQGTVTANHDTDYGDETFTVALGALPPEATAGVPASVTVTVTDDDVPPVVSLAATTPVDEGASATVTVTLSPPPLAETTIPLTLTAGEWADRGDFGALASVTVAADAASGTGTVAANHDADAFDETFTVALGTLPAPLTAGTPTSVVVTIDDDETHVPPAATLEVPAEVDEGESLALTATLASALREDVTIPLDTFRLGAEPEDLGPVPDITVAAGSTSGTAALATNHDDDQSDETFLVYFDLTALPATVRAGEPHSASVTIVDDDKPAATVASAWLLPSASDAGRLGVVRVVNRSGVAGDVKIVATDDSGRTHSPLTLRLDAGAAAQFDSRDLEAGNALVGLAGATGPGSGDWRLSLSSALDVEALAYVRAAGGFVAALDATAPREADGALKVALFNPASELDQRSLLRLVNPGAAEALAVVSGVDDAGRSPGAPVRLSLAAGAACTLDAAQLESGAGLPCGAAQPGIGDGFGRWRLTVASDAPLVAMNLLEGTAGRLSNLSGISSAGADGVWHVPLFPPASDPSGRQGLVRIVNRSDRPGTVSIAASDDGNAERAPLTLRLPGYEAVDLDADDLELGNRDKGLAGSAGAGTGAWRLALRGDVPFDAPAYVRGGDGFLTTMQATSPSADGAQRIAFLAPETGILRLANAGTHDALVTVAGKDDLGHTPGTTVQVAVPAGAAVELTTTELESGAAAAIVAGKLGAGAGVWRLSIDAGRSAVSAMSLLPGPMGSLNNLSGPNRPANPAAQSATAR